VTIEAIAAESGVAKTTIYRRHADREAVLRAALEAAMTPPREATGDTPREKIRWALDAAWRQTSELLGRGGLSALVADTRPLFSDLFRSVLTPYTEALADLIRADAAAGTLRPDVDADAAVSLLFGAYLGELVRRGQVSEGFSDRCVDLIWAAFVRQGDSAR
jgi:AcrR family transcriptional regulator